MWQDGERSLAYLTVDGASPLQHVEAAAAAGFPAAGLRILPPVHLAGDPSVVGDAQAVKELREACKRAGVRPLDAEVLSLSSATSRDEMRAMVETAAELGFRFVQTVVEDEDLSRAADRLAALAAEAGNAGLSVALEFMAFRPLDTLDAANAMIERAAAANVGLLIDALHLARSGGTPADVAKLPAGRIAMFQLCDAPATPPPFAELASEARGARRLPGDGDLWLDALADVLPDGLPVSIEVPQRAAAGTPFADLAKRAAESLDRFTGRRADRLRAAAATPA